MIGITKEQLLSIHEMLAQKTGGSSGVINEALLDSALNNIWQSFDGVELYPTLEEKAARLAYSLVSNHSFRDGNKRIGILAMLTFLSVNGRKISCSDEEIVETGLSLACGLMDYEALLSWLTEHCITKDPENRTRAPDCKNKVKSIGRR